MTQPYEEFEQTRSNNAVYWLIGLCIGVYFVQATLIGDRNMVRMLGYSPGDVESNAYWTIFTYMFVHGGILHLGVNMWTLWLFGPRVERAWGTRAFTWFYVWCGFTGWLFHYMFQAQVSVLVGASAAILGVAVAYASRWPDDEVLFFGVVPMKVRWLVAFMAFINIAMTFLDSGSMGGTAYAAHFGGMAGAWVYLRAPGSGSIDRLRKRISPAPDYGDEAPRPIPRGNQQRSRERQVRDPDDIVAQSKAATARARTTPRQSVAPVVRAATGASAVDAVLDKIAAKGIESLTLDERTLLEEWSRKLREN